MFLFEITKLLTDLSVFVSISVIFLATIILVIGHSDSVLTHNYLLTNILQTSSPQPAHVKYEPLAFHCAHCAPSNLGLIVFPSTKIP